MIIMSSDKSVQYDGEFIKVVIIPGFKKTNPGIKSMKYYEKALLSKV